METPLNLKYASTDEWLLVEGNVATLGVSDYAQDQLSDVVFVEINAETGTTVEKGSIVATIESVKAAADVTLPVSGRVIAINEDLANSPELINSDPYGAAWMLKVELADLKELDALMDAKSYLVFCESRGH